MLNKLFEIEKDIMNLVFDRLLQDMRTMYIDYHGPIVERIWFDYDGLRIYLHKIHKCNKSTDALFHPHPWKSAIRILKGSYEMGVGHSSDNTVPSIDCKLILPEGSCYEMTEENGWHYVNPITDYVYSLMITGERSSRKMPVEPNKDFRELTNKEYADVFNACKEYYDLKKQTWGNKDLMFINGKFQ